MRLTLLAFGLLTLATAAPAQDLDAARRLAQQAIIVDTHIDAPGRIGLTWPPADPDTLNTPSRAGHFVPGGSFSLNIRKI